MCATSWRSTRTAEPADFKKSDRSKLEQSVQKRTHAGSSSQTGTGGHGPSAKLMRSTMQFRAVVSGVAHFKVRWEHSPAWAAHPTGDLTLNGSASFSGISVAGSSGNHPLDLYVYFFPVRDETEPQSRIGQFCSDLRKPRDYKSGSALKRLRDRKSTRLNSS